MKRKDVFDRHAELRSRPARGAWIETSLRGISVIRTLRRAPHGARGLKHLDIKKFARYLVSRPARGAWIETLPWRIARSTVRVAPRTGRVD